MCEKKFIKFVDSKELDYLREHYPNAFLLLSLIESRACRISDNPNGLEMGEALIGDYKKAGIETEKKYRIAKKILKDRGHIEIVETCKNNKKQENLDKNYRATSGTKVKLLHSAFYDSNIELKGDPRATPRATQNSSLTISSSSSYESKIKDKGDPKGDPYSNNQMIRATPRATPNDNLNHSLSDAYNRKNIGEGDSKGEELYLNMNINKKKENILKEKAPEPEKIAFRECVFLTQSEYDKLLAVHGQIKLDSMMDFLHSYKGRSGKIYKSDYYAMDRGSFVVKEIEKQAVVVNQYAVKESNWQKNKQHAEIISKTFFSKNYELECNGKEIVIIPLNCNQVPFSLKYAELGFVEQLEGILRKYDFRKTQLNNDNQTAFKRTEMAIESNKKTF
jgi:hypothetical protein